MKSFVAFGNDCGSGFSREWIARNPSRLKPLPQGEFAVINTRARGRRMRGMTLVEIMIALSIASLMTLTGWRALDTLQVSRDRVVNDAAQWQRLDDFFANLEADLRHASLSEFAANGDAMAMVQPSLSRGADTRRVSYRWLATNERVDVTREAGGERLPVAEVQSISVAYSNDGVTFESTTNAYPRAIRISVIPLTSTGALPPVERVLALR